MFGELLFQACRQLSVGFKNVTNDRYFHNKLLYSASICWTYSSRPVSIEMPVLLAAGWTRRKEVLSLDGRESMSALGTLESDGNLLGFQHSAFEVGSRQ